MLHPCNTAGKILCWSGCDFWVKISFSSLFKVSNSCLQSCKQLTRRHGVRLRCLFSAVQLAQLTQTHVSKKAINLDKRRRPIYDKSPQISWSVVELYQWRPLGRHISALTNAIFHNNWIKDAIAKKTRIAGKLKIFNATQLDRLHLHTIALDNQISKIWISSTTEMSMFINNTAANHVRFLLNLVT